jgi:hypothetical protein
MGPTSCRKAPLVRDTRDLWLKERAHLRGRHTVAFRVHSPRWDRLARSPTRREDGRRRRTGSLPGTPTGRSRRRSPVDREGSGDRSARPGSPPGAAYRCLGGSRRRHGRWCRAGGRRRSCFRRHPRRHVARDAANLALELPSVPSPRLACNGNGTPRARLPRSSRLRRHRAGREGRSAMFGLR